EKYHAAKDKMKTALEQRHREFDEKKLEWLEKEKGKKLAWHDLRFFMRARDLVQAILDDPRTKKTVEKQRFLALFSNLNQDYHEFESYAASNPKSQESWQYRDDKSFFVEIKLFKRQLDEESPAFDGLTPKQIDEIVEDYNRLISHRNMNIGLP